MIRLARALVPLASALVVAVGLAAPAHAQTAPKTSTPPVIDRVLTFDVRSTATQTATQAGQTTDAASEWRMTIDVATTALDAAGFGGTIAIRHYRFSDERGGVKNFDSAAPDADATAKALAPDIMPLIGPTVRFKMLSSGQVLEVGGVDLLPQTKALPRIKSQIFGVDAARRVIAPAFSTRAPDDVEWKPGATWTASDEAAVGPDLIATARHTYTIDRIEGDVASISIRSVVDWPPMPERDGVKVASIATELTGTQTWNFATGLLVKYEGQQTTTATYATPKGDVHQETIAKVFMEPVTTAPPAASE